MSDHRFADERYARAFIRRQLGEYQLAGITTMTAKQRQRMDALEVIHPWRKDLAQDFIDVAHLTYGPPPHARTGRMRVQDMHTVGRSSWPRVATAARAAATTGSQEPPR